MLVDDGSKDDSVELARRLALDEPRLKVFVNEVNLGTYGTEQRGLELSQSEFVAVMNSDDLWAPEKLSKQVALLERHSESYACYVLGKMVDDGGKVIADEDVHADWPREEIQDAVPFLLFENRILASGVLFRRDRLSFETTLRYSGDWVALLQAAERGPLACVADDLVFWRQHGNNTYRRSERQMIEEIRVRRAILNSRRKWMALGRDRMLIRRGLEKNHVNLASLLLYFVDAASLRNCVWQAVVSGLYHPALVKRSLASLVSVRKTRAIVWRLESVFPESTADAQRAIREQIPLAL